MALTESCLLLPSGSGRNKNKVPEDKWDMAYIVYFTLGLGYLLPWNAFITAVDYFSYLYPDASVDRIFAVVYMLIGLVGISLIIFYSHKSNAYVRINVGLALFVISLLIIPLLDAFYLKGRVGLMFKHLIPKFVPMEERLLGKVNPLNDFSLLGFRPEVVLGVLVSALRIFTKAVYPQDASGLQKSANLYFFVSIVIVFVCMVFYNMVHKLPVMKYYKELKVEAVTANEDNGPLTGAVWRSTVWNIVGRIKWYGFGIVLIYIVTLAIFPGYITEDVHSQILKDWYPILLIAGYNVFDLVGKCLTAVYLLQNAKVAIGGCIARLLFFPLFLGCLHGPKFFRTEIPVTILTCLLGLTNGYLTSVLMILIPKIVKLQHAETAGIVSVLFLVFGLAAGSVIAWIWVI
ncbi:Equilibrative nucleoside transporter 4 [Glycine soja]|uniref:Equilibrative nucleoside transporter 4 n=1 Tax=Glycine soja TaxID=3848 RepID=A0A0B2RD91_GLYSO|nr:Equilibrative nucleoside transporter 4 [Glycine soja]